MKRLLILAILLLTSGCAHWEKHNQAQFDKYIGRHIDSMYEEYGAPRAIAPTQDGYFIEFASTASGFLCTARVKTDRNKIIIAIGTGGQNGCITGKY